MNKYCQRVKVLECEPFGQPGATDDFHLIRVENPGWGSWRAGQFMMLRPDSFGLETTWGRPFSICRADSESVSVFFQVVGRGTAKLAEMKAGESLDMWGPLGNGFAVEPDTPTLMLAGGVGLAPFFGYMENHPTLENLELFFAHRPPLWCYPYEFMSLGVKSEAFQEKDPSDIPRIVERMGELMAGLGQNGLVLACGPTPFLRSVRDQAKAHGVRAQLSLENRMACGVGACLGCVCEDKDHWPVQVCTHGPVFWADDIRLEGDE